MKNILSILSVLLLGLVLAGCVKKSLPEEPFPAPPPQMAPLPQIEKIILADVTQRYVHNDQAGLLLVIDGNALNGYDTPRRDIVIEFSLYDALGALVTAKRARCGNRLSEMQLTGMGLMEIEASLNDLVGVLAYNSNVRPGEKAPFMMVFPDPPGNVAEFGVRIVDARQVPEGEL
jgi:hypothetical protein